jgi:hypothetical protein
MKRLPFVITVTLFLFGCTRDDGMYEYELNGVVSEVISCNEESGVCKAWVYKGNNDKYHEIWNIAGQVQSGDKVLKTCRFTIVEIEGEDESRSAGLSSRSNAEKSLNNANCDHLAYLD